MPAPTFTRPIEGSAPNQFVQNLRDEAAINEALRQLWLAIAAGEGEEQVTLVLNAALSALSDANRAEVARDDAQGVLPDRLRRDVATLIADDDLTYTAAQPGTVTENDIIRTRAEGISYVVLASGATDQDLTTAGGVKLRYLSGGHVNDPSTLKRSMGCAIRNNWAGDAVTVTGATAANPVVITTAAAHGYSSGDTVQLASLGGMVQVNLNFYTIANVTSTTFELTDETGANVNGTSFTAYTSGGTARKVEGWRYIDDSGHVPNGFSTIDITQTPPRAIRLNYNFTASKVGSLTMQVDEEFAQKDVTSGPSVGLDSAQFFFYQDIRGTVNHGTLQVDTPAFFGNRPTAVRNSDQTITVTHNSTGKMEPPLLTLGSPGGLAPRYVGFPKLLTFTTTQFTYGLYAPLRGTVTYNGSAWVVTCNSHVKPVVTAFGGYLELNFGSSIDPENVQLTGITPSLTVPYIYHLFSPQSNKIRIVVSDLSGAVQNGSPTTNMTFDFHSDEMVLLESSADGFVNFHRCGAILNPNHVVAPFGNFWVMGEMDVT